MLSDVLLEVLAEKQVFGMQGKLIVVPIPLTRARKRRRGYNQSALLAHALIKNHKDLFVYAPSTLVKVRTTIAQAKIKNKAERLKNLKGAFQVNDPLLVRGKVIILVDDVTTTGATVREARNVLKQAGARDVIAGVVAH